MKVWKLCFLLSIANVLLPAIAYAQGQKIFTPKTYAVVVGISQYEHAAIPRLMYADKDATLFAGWLQSKAGGSVPAYQVKLLTNENATIANVYTALDWLKAMAREDDKVYIYFSGHGDIETSEKISEGYLLAWNSPSTNYRNNAVSVADLNENANTLTTINKADVILITDACHSGKMAGDFYKGRQLTAANLRRVLNNQVRLASCAPGEEAAEGPAWGGGRGAFSYHLLRGLQGMAAVDSQGAVRLSSLQSFLEDAFKKDPALASEQHKQHPVVDGSPIYPIAFQDRTNAMVLTLKQAPTSSPLPVSLQSLKALGRQPIDYFFAIFQTAELDTLLPFANYTSLPIPDLPLQMVNDYMASLSRINQPQDAGRWDTLNMLQRQLGSNRFAAVRFNEKLIELTHLKMQDMINAYLTGDLAELEKRQYYYTRSRQYRSFLPVIKVAIHVAQEKHYLTRILRTNLAYLSGLVDRLQMATNRQTDSLLHSAFLFQREAMKMDPYAAYIHNELGNLHLQQNLYDSAAYHFDYALLLSPTWAIPWSNKIRLHLAMNQLAHAKEAIHIADSLQPNLSFVNVNAGLAMEKDRNWLAAETYYLRAIAQNNIHYLPFQRLGMVYIQAGNYALADSFLMEAKNRKELFSINEAPFKHGIMMVPNPLNAPDRIVKTACNFQRTNQQHQPTPQLLLAHGLLGNGDTSTSNFYKAIGMWPSVPLAHHYLGSKHFFEGNWQLSEKYLLEALRNYLPADSLGKVLRAQMRLPWQQDAHDLLGNASNDSGLTETDSCLLGLILSYHYDELEDLYMLASIYEQLGYVDRALSQYQIISKKENERLRAQATSTALMNEPPQTDEDRRDRARFNTAVKTTGTIKAARLLEKQGRYQEAEELLLQQVLVNREAGDARQATMKNAASNSLPAMNSFWLSANHDLEAETYNFYTRVLALFPRDARWHDATGMFLYRRLALSYSQVPIEEQTAFYNYSLTQGYPYVGKAGGHFFQNEIVLYVPGNGERLILPLPQYDPLVTARHHLQEAERFSADAQARPALLAAITNLNKWMGKTEAAIHGFKALLTLQPDDVATREAFIEMLEFNKYFIQASSQLDSLRARTSLTSRQILKQVYYKMLSKQADEGLRLLRGSLPVDSAEQYLQRALYAQLFLLAGESRTAQGYLDTLLKQNARELVNANSSWAAFSSRRNLAYATVRTLALKNETGRTISSLKRLREYGNVFRNVFENDPALSELRRTRRWRKLIRRTPFAVPLVPGAQAWELVQETGTDGESDARNSLQYRLRLYRIPGSVTR